LLTVRAGERLANRLEQGKEEDGDQAPCMAYAPLAHKLAHMTRSPANRQIRNGLEDRRNPGALIKRRRRDVDQAA
jgi:hypothetical protein